MIDWENGYSADEVIRELSRFVKNVVEWRVNVWLDGNITLYGPYEANLDEIVAIRECFAGRLCTIFPCMGEDRDKVLAIEVHRQ